MIEERETRGERVADAVARFGGSWSFIIAFSVVLSVYTIINVRLGARRGIHIRLSCSTCSCP